ncbi:hypothetical protein [Hyperthermus butylicus]|uniref:Uncharacterized protein n=1 Tax=Hyperthermus butylicus (strain DSM 5456 / JCM 9403 / PLM1-5) TaxID=415426 RepID=A2BLM9_HYPBU|nr:hypothetical protein [Hyperthermus butylicus]ABM80890.1 hypothetical protein Hbut_1046 [Hyperthermus butylicus DSM 5456]
MQQYSRGEELPLTPPRPDIGALVVAVMVGALLVAAGKPTGLAFFLAAVAGLVALPILFLARELAVFHAGRKPLEPSKAGLVADWVAAVAREAGAQKTSILYVYRRGVSLQVVQFGEPIARERNPRLEAGLTWLVHRAAWNGLLATMLHRGLLIVALPARTMHMLYRLVGWDRHGPYVVLKGKEAVITVYRALREMLTALSQGANRAYIAYAATKLATRLLVRGLLRIDPTEAERLDALLPAEPPWVRWRVQRQLAEEAVEAIGA